MKLKRVNSGNNFYSVVLCRRETLSVTFTEETYIIKNDSEVSAHIFREMCTSHSFLFLCLRLQVNEVFVLVCANRSFKVYTLRLNCANRTCSDKTKCALGP